MENGFNLQDLTISPQLRANAYYRKSADIADKLLCDAIWPRLKECLSRYRENAQEEPRIVFTQILPICACEAVGGQGEDALPLATAWQFKLLAAQLLDDLQDGDEGNWGRLSKAERLMASTLFLGAADMALSELVVTLETRNAISVELAQMTMFAAAGQTLILREPSLPDYFDKLARKTALLFSSACRAGALVANVEQEDVERIYNVGWNIGAMRQILDDHGDVAEDMQRGEWTLPLIYAASLENGEAFRQRFFAKSLEEDELDLALVSLEKSGALSWSLQQAYERHQDAVKILEELPQATLLQHYVTL